jgi:hypothetical protein
MGGVDPGWLGYVRHVLTIGFRNGIFKGAGALWRAFRDALPAAMCNARNS